MQITWWHSRWVTWLGGRDTLTLNRKGYGKSSRTQWQKFICITNWGKLFLQIEADLLYYKLGQTLQIEETSLLQIGTSVVTNWGKLGQSLLQNRTAITNWGSYSKLGQSLLPNRTAITNCGKIYYKLGQFHNRIFIAKS